MGLMMGMVDSPGSVESLVAESPASVTIGLLAPDDDDSLVRFYWAQPRLTFQRLPPRNDKQCEAWVRSLLRGVNLAAKRADGTLAGHAALCPGEGQNDYELLVCVALDSRGLGIGTELVERAIEEAMERDARGIVLSVESGNLAARRIYQKFGFKYVEKFALQPRKRNDELIMRLPLPDLEAV